MRQDPYALCPCGVGTKQKWCAARDAMTQLDQAIGMVRNNQQESSLALLDKLIADEKQPECFRAYATTVKAQALDSFGKPHEAVQYAEEATQKFPQSGMVRETFGDFFFVDHDYSEAHDVYQSALSLFPVEAVEQICRTLYKLGTCHNFQGRPLAAWACWQRALKLDAGFEPAKKAMDEFVHQNGLLPNAARHGLSLKTADEFTLFNEEIGDRWESAVRAGEQLHLDDLAMAFEAVTAQEPNNAAAWYNLALARAWMGQNVQAIEALSQYVERENDLNLAADAWDIAEVLRMGGGAEDLSDNLLYIALYEVKDPNAFIERLQKTKHMVVVSTPDGHRTLHWMDKEVNPDASGLPLLGGPPRQLAQFNMYGQVLEIVATNEVALRDVLVKFDLVVGETVRLETKMTRAGNSTTLDSEPFLIFDNNKGTPEERQAKTLDAVRQYFEETWIHRPLRSLDGVSPIDAAQSPRLKKRLEGLIRFRERGFARHNVPYNFDRLRNKLGLPISGTGVAEQPTPNAATDDVDVTAYSAAQLAALQPGKLSDAELVLAYKTAVSLDAGTTATHFAEELAHRTGLADVIDMNGVYRRLIQQRLSAKKLGDLADLIDKGRRMDAESYGGREQAQYELFTARADLAAGRKEEAIGRFRSLPDTHSDRLDLAASAVETLLSAGEYQAAREIAEASLSRAEQGRDGEMQSVFREFVREAAARS